MNTSTNIPKKAKRRDIQIIVVLVLILTVITLRVSYSSFFSVQSLSTIQEIETGNLEVAVSINNENSILNDSIEIFPTENSEVSTGEGNYSILNLNNKGNLNADYSVSISYDYDALRAKLGNNSLTVEQLEEQLVSFDYLHIGIVPSTTNTWMNFSEEEGREVFFPTISTFVSTERNNNIYPVLRKTINANLANNEGNAISYKIYIWLDEDTPETQIEKYVYLKINVKCAAGNETITEEVQI